MESQSRQNRSLKSYLIPALVMFLVTLLLLILLGPVWIYDVEERIVGVIFGIIVIFLILALIGGGDALAATSDVAMMGVEAAGLGARIFQRLLFGSVPAMAGMAIGLVLALFVAWLLSRTEAMRLTYARARPEKALASDYINILPVLEDYEKANGRPPKDHATLVQAIRDAGVEVRYSTLDGDIWKDPWGVPFHYESKRKYILFWTFSLYSYGKNNADDGGEGDDISIAATMKTWDWANDVLDSLFERKKEDK